MKAFPSGFGLTPYEYGMDLRDYFAAKAMQGYISCKGWHPDFEMNFDKQYAKDGKTCNVVSEVCYKWADAMMKAREQK